MYEPLIPNVHYIEFFDDDIKNKITNKENWSELTETINLKFSNLTHNINLDDIKNNAREWFERNCLPDNQLKIFYSFMEDFKIFESSEIKTDMKKDLIDLKKILELVMNKINEIESKI